MYVKKNTVIPEGFKITKCPPGYAAGRSIYQLQREEEARLEAEATKVEAAPADKSDRENEYGAGIKAGLSVEQSIGESDR